MEPDRTNPPAGQPDRRVLADIPAPHVPLEPVFVGPPGANARPAGGRVRLVSREPAAPPSPALPASEPRVRKVEGGPEQARGPLPETPTPITLRYQTAEGDVTLVIPPGIAEAMARHAEESGRRDVEVGGFLVGTVERVHRTDAQVREAAEATGYLVTVTDVLKLNTRQSSSSHVKFDAGAWAQLNSACDRLFTPQGKVRLGWYHTHPTQGIFYSDHDLNSHLEWRRPFQFGLVIDPHTMACGLFHWKSYPADPDAVADRVRDHLAGHQIFRLRQPRASLPYAAGGGAVSVPVPPTRVFDRATFTIVASLVGVLAASLFALSLPIPSARGQAPPFDPTVGLLALSGALYAVLRLWNAGAFHTTDPPPHDPATSGEVLWWRLLIAVGGLSAAAGRAYDLIPGPGGLAVCIAAGLILVEAWMAGAFHSANPLEARIGSSLLARLDRAFGGVRRRVGKLLAPAFQYTVNPLSVTAAGALFYGVFLLVNATVRAAAPDAPPETSGFALGGVLAVAGILMFVGSELIRAARRDPDGPPASPIRINVRPTAPEEANRGPAPTAQPRPGA